MSIAERECVYIYRVHGMVKREYLVHGEERSVEAIKQIQLALRCHSCPVPCVCMQVCMYACLSVCVRAHARVQMKECIHRYPVQTCMDISACRHMCVYTSHIYMSTIKVLCEDCKHGGDEEKDGDGAHDGVE